jgi:hypothetical protein
MAETFHHISIKRARKLRRCCWCGELIEIGAPYEQWRYKDHRVIGTVRMHTGCEAAYRALLLQARTEGFAFTWSIGDFKRGIVEAR